VRFLLLTTARRTEALRLRWEEIDGTIWTPPAARNKAKFELTRPLSKAAQALLASLPRINDGAFVFTLDGVHAMSESEQKRKLDAASGLRGWKLHDLRRTGRTLLSRAGIDPDHAERCLGHKIGGVRAVYDHHKFGNEMQRAFEALAALIERIVNAGRDHAAAASIALTDLQHAPERANDPVERWSARWEEQIAGHQLQSWRSGRLSVHVDTCR
jgi:integrase